jgi:ribosomal protein S16
MAKKRKAKKTKIKRKRTAKKTKPKSQPNRDAEAIEPVGTYVPGPAT